MRIRTRRVIYAQDSLSVPGSMHLGTFDTGGYAKFAGFVSALGSVTVRYRMGITSATVAQVSSSFVINSGTGTFDVVNLGMRTEFWLSAANSQVLPSIMIFGEASR